MEIDILAVGRLKAGPERELCGKYLDRARKSGRPLGFRGFAVRELPESRAARPSERVAQEGAALLGMLAGGGRVVCLSEEGELLDSQQFALRLGRAAGAALPRTTFVIGGPDGLDESVKTAAPENLSFGRLTWPHQIARLLLAEQLYRAMTILSGHPYHRV
jgi:23S rRNA (pseudouridine1915-N3)-methyltransferase